MNVKMLLSLGLNDYPNHPFRHGEIHAVDDAMGSELIARHFAVRVDDQGQEQEESTKPRQRAKDHKSAAISADSSKSKPELSEK